MVTKAEYNIRIGGILDASWAETFDEMSMEYDDEDNTRLRGYIDQATLHGFLKKIHDLGLTILDVNLIDKAE